MKFVAGSFMAGSNVEDVEQESRRLAELRKYEILDTPPDGAFDDLTKIASRLFNVPISIVSLVDTDRVWFKSAHGLDEPKQIDRGPGLCASAIMSDDVYVAEDLRLDPNSLSNPLVANDQGFRFYAAEPLRSADGYNLGTFCVLDVAPRKFSDEDRDLLKCLGRLVMSQMEQRLSARRIASLARTVNDQNKLLAHAANHDALTGVLNRRSIEARMTDFAQSRSEFSGAILLLDVDHFKVINDTYGHPAGDAVLVEISRRIANTVRAEDYVGRYGGEEFIVVLGDCGLDVATRIAERIRGNIESHPIAIPDHPPLRITVSGGLCHNSADCTMETTIKLADDALYAAKKAGRNKIVISQRMKKPTECVANNEEALHQI
ncbi:MAG: sensor domain-containing diguanylate cyclase [Hyphomicrobiaceae bacterium]|nr:sensor domain-containing diguanylate cyclase [Hyphomicrobiaceae bacterium]